MSAIEFRPLSPVLTTMITSVRKEEEAILHLLQVLERGDLEGLVAAAEWLKSVRSGAENCASDR